MTHTHIDPDPWVLMGPGPMVGALWVLGSVKGPIGPRPYGSGSMGRGPRGPSPTHRSRPDPQIPSDGVSPGDARRWPPRAAAACGRDHRTRRRVCWSCLVLLLVHQHIVNPEPRPCCPLPSKATRYANVNAFLPSSPSSSYHHYNN